MNDEKVTGSAEKVKDSGAGLDFLTRKRRDASSGAFRSRVIQIVKVVFPLSALALMAVLMLWSDMDSTMSTFTYEELRIPEAGQNELINPRFESRDNKKQPYTITAHKAMTTDGNKDLVFLTRPLADITLDNGAWVAVEAMSGEYFQERQFLSLRGSVKLFHNEGYQMESEELNVSLKNQIAESQKSVFGQGPAGLIDAEGVRANGESGDLVFYGPAKLTLYNGLKLPDAE